MGRYAFKLPDVGEGTAEAEIVAWHVKPGDVIAEDAPLVDVMTDKATVEMTSPVSGRVLEINGVVGDMAAVGSVLAVMETDAAAEASGAEPAAPSVAEPERPRPAPQPAAAEAPVRPPEPKPARPAPTPAAEAATGGSPAARRGFEPGAPRDPELRPLASPAVRRRAEALGVKLSYVRGSGPAGRIEHADLDRHLQEERTSGPARSGARPRPGPSRPEVEEIKVVGLRRRIAEKMQEAKRRIPHFSYVEEVDVTELEALRAHLNSARPERGRLTALPFFARAMIRALDRFPALNARFDDEAGVVRRYGPVHLGVATQTPSGLMVPVVRDAQDLDLWEIGREVARLAEAARSGKAKSEELTGSTITLTSLGPLGGVATTPVINHPEVAIVGPNKIVERPVVRGGAVVVRKMMNVSSSFDHRVVDGADAAEFIQTIRGLLEHPAALFVD